MKSVRIKETILLANASQEIEEQLRSALGGVFNILAVTGEDRVITMASRELPKLIILESERLSTNKFDLCQRIAREEALASIPVIVVIEQADIQNMAEGFYRGASDYMVKPLIPAEVLVRVGGQLELASATAAVRAMRQKQSENAQVSTELSQPHSADQSESKYRILIVDDYPGNLNALVEALETTYTVVTASNGHDALKIAMKEYFDVILLDVVMPGMDGYEVCLKLKANDKTSDTPIIFLTGQMEAQDEIHGFNLGAADYIYKPYSLSVVMARVRNHINAARHQKQLKCYSYQDSLTNIPNRRQFDEVLTKEYKRAVREAKPISLLVIDIDEFKLYNDHFGHIMGDDCLRKVGRALARCQHRATDFVGRYGGEEFVAVLPDTDESGALHMAQSMLDAVRDLQVPQAPDAQRKCVTVSIGAATCAADLTHTPKELLECADALLYEAKNGGRNQLRIATFGSDAEGGLSTLQSS